MEGEIIMRKLIYTLLISSLAAVIMTGCGPDRAASEDDSSRLSDSVIYISPAKTSNQIN